MLHAIHTHTSHIRFARALPQSPILALVIAAAIVALTLLASPRSAAAATCD